jgi:murein DD-endopeptidase MepM/ murein hydrolase activator NlpD
MGHSLTRRGRVSIVGVGTLALVALIPTLLPSASARVADGTQGRIAGMGIMPSAQPQPVTNTDLGRLRSDGINTASIDAFYDVDGATQSHVTPGERTLPDAVIAQTIKAAQQAGQRTILTPKVWCPSCSRTWRGKLQPQNVNQFFDEYRAFVTHYAALARQNGVSLFMIGTEMNSLQGNTAQWRQTAHAVRGQYKGSIGYNIDWSTLAGFGDPVRFWDEVDIASVSAYFPLSDAARPSVADLMASWQSSQTAKFRGLRWVDRLAALAWTSKKQVMFGEAGYVSSTYAAREPFNDSFYAGPGQDVQRNAYQALLSTFEGKSWWQGVVWWEWVMNDPGKSTYSPRDKLAESFMKSWYRDGWRP